MDNTGMMIVLNYEDSSVMLVYILSQERHYMRLPL